MTTTLTPSEPAATDELTLRILPIAANLLPVEIVAFRRGRKLRRRVLSGLAGFVVLLGAWYGLARYQTSTADANLTAAGDDAQVVLHQQRAFADVVTVQAQSKAITTQLSTLLAHDLPWSALLASLQDAAPPGVQVTGVSGALTPDTTAAAAGSRATANDLPNTSGEELVGRLVLTGTSTGQVAVAAYLDALAKTSGLGNPMLNGVLAQGAQLQFTIRLDITGAALGGRYTATGADGSGER
jgi:Tfp pilus assembly protein PilN